MKGDNEGKVVIAGDPAKGRFAMVLHGKPMMMPPGGALDKAKVAAVEAWIKAAARGSRVSRRPLPGARPSRN